MAGAGVPCPVHAKSQTQRRATANPKTEGSAATHRQYEVPAISTRKPSHCGKSQNHSEKNSVPAMSEVIAAGQCSSCAAVATFPECAVVISPPIALRTSLTLRFLQHD